jgi:AraC-like DNA-binding protein
MATSETLQEFYQKRFEWIPESLNSFTGHVNVFRLPHPANKPMPYRRRDFFKITLCRGGSRIHYADRVFFIEKQALVFSNPFIPYQWEHLEKEVSGFYVIFNADFFNQFGSLQQYDIFQPTGTNVFELDDNQFENTGLIFEKMIIELNSEYQYKFDVIRNQIYEIMHSALKSRHSSPVTQLPVNASLRIYWLFLELLERQFPLDKHHTQIKYKSPADFAKQLNVHINHLNKTLKHSCGQTTSEVISDRRLREAKFMLKQNSRNISEIAYCLGFKEVTHFNNFFKKHTNMNPMKFRMSDSPQ